jgi:hypothetical protein
MQGRARGLSVPALLVAVVLLAGCGGDDPEAAPEQPALPSALAEELATQADGLADTLEAGDLCAAERRAEELAATATAAISREQVPTAMEEELRSTVDLLVSRIACEEGDEEKDEGEERGKGKGNGKGSGKGDD